MPSIVKNIKVIKLDEAILYKNKHKIKLLSCHFLRAGRYRIDFGEKGIAWAWCDEERQLHSLKGPALKIFYVYELPHEYFYINGKSILKEDWIVEKQYRDLMTNG